MGALLAGWFCNAVLAEGYEPDIIGDTVSEQPVVTPARR